MEEPALREALTGLINEKQAWVQVKNEFVQDEIELIERFQQRSREMKSQMEITKRVLNDFPQADSVLQAYSKYEIPDPTSGIFDKRGILFSFQPTRSCKASGNTDIANLPPRPYLSSEQDSQIKKQTPAETGAQRSTENVPQGSRKYLSKPPLSPSPRVLRSRPLSTETKISTSGPALLGFMQLDPIKTTQVTKGNYWIFDYIIHSDNRPHSALFTMRCPSSSCDNPVFTKHPLRRQRAAKHLKRCRVPFKDTKDMVRRYARLVVQDRKGRAVTWSWAHKHNLRLLAGDEEHLASENLAVS
ncbi:hypothetical protein F4779DRAFT_618077 [Xylariaceae sp. FL0662B]|nr:hypothetical protein F4779DRAFT_618077 [Xylariaceae sp. FL0662B]